MCIRDRPHTDFANGETVTVTIDDAQVEDQDATDPPGTMAADYVFDFTIVSAVPICDQAFTPIYDIQGSGASVPTPGNVTTEGVVVGDFQTSAGVQGFFIQDPTGDANTATSDGIFVFTGTTDNTVNAGDYVRVEGYARERFNQTTLNGSNSNTAIVPAANIINCGTGSVSAVDVTMPFASTTLSLIHICHGAGFLAGQLADGRVAMDEALPAIESQKAPHPRRAALGVLEGAALREVVQ